ncbi:MFS general substrate transporter domain-containing protein [Dioscorea alata]|uniref:MFS general substrate transporter domain-containing protein n=1 Tax=Dioscorea alata TaxID=55571 RepID=A0ACB7VFI6_DIOAL|nr:MFS general substrate transporter domain-containing protein [Dioscorea alata]
MSSSAQQWLSLVGAIWLQTINGPNSDFPVYSSELKDLLSISQLQLNNLAFASDAGKLFGWLSGLAAVYLPLWLVLLIGSCLGLIGYGFQFLFLVNKFSKLSYWHVFLLTVLAGNGICWINTVCYLICIQNFSSNQRSAVLGISTSYVGLSAKVYTVLADSFFHFLTSQSKAKSYLLLNATVPMLASIVTSPFTRKIHPANQEQLKSSALLFLFIITIATGVCAVISSVGSMSSGRRLATQHAISLGLLLTLPLVIPVAMKFKQVLEDNKVHDLVSIHQVDVKEASDDNQSKEENIGASSMIKKLNFWLYYFSYLFSATLGLVFLNNLGQIAESRGLSKTSSLVSISSSFGFFGRLVPSLLDFYFSKNGRVISRTASMTILMAPIAGSFFLLLNQSNLSLYISTAVIGACTGAITCIAVSTTPELFGIKHFGVNHNVVVTNIPIGSLIFGFFAALVYQNKENGSRSCMGKWMF